MPSRSRRKRTSRHCAGLPDWPSGHNISAAGVEVGKAPAQGFGNGQSLAQLFQTLGVVLLTWGLGLAGIEQRLGTRDVAFALVAEGIDHHDRDGCRTVRDVTRLPLQLGACEADHLVDG